MRARSPATCRACHQAQAACHFDADARTPPLLRRRTTSGGTPRRWTCSTCSAWLATRTRRTATAVKPRASRRAVMVHQTLLQHRPVTSTCCRRARPEPGCVAQRRLFRCAVVGHGCAHPVAGRAWRLPPHGDAAVPRVALRRRARARLRVRGTRSAVGAVCDCRALTHHFARTPARWWSQPQPEGLARHMLLISILLDDTMSVKGARRPGRGVLDRSRC